MASSFYLTAVVDYIVFMRNTFKELDSLFSNDYLQWVCKII